jgi:uncharacterized membrane protein
MKKRSQTYYIVLYAIYAALIFVARILDQLITSSALPINFAVITLSITFAVAFIEPSLKNGFIAGFIFGMSSFITSFIFAKPLIFGFANPLISVFPRMIVGIVLFLSFKGFFELFKLVFKNSKLAMGFAIPFACAIGAFTNTAIVLSMIWVFKVLEGMDVLYVIFVTNAIPELVIPAIIVPGIVFGVRSGLRIKDKYNTVLSIPEKREDGEQKTEENV